MEEEEEEAGESLCGLDVGSDKMKMFSSSLEENCSEVK
jgi:hypothetical protein